MIVAAGTSNASSEERLGHRLRSLGVLPVTLFSDRDDEVTNCRAGGRFPGRSQDIADWESLLKNQELDVILLVIFHVYIPPKIK